MAGGCSLTSQAQDAMMPDALPQASRGDKQAEPLQEIYLPESMTDTNFGENSELNIDNLLAVLDKYDVKEKRIVLAQALLETGYFSSQLCMEGHNLFGLRHPSDGSYYTFNTWEESVKAYRDDVQYKYSGGNYYAFLKRIGYAEDRNYTSKVKKIADKLAL